MDIETIKDLQAKRAGIALHLRPVKHRDNTEWQLVALFEVLDTLGKKPVPANVVIATARQRYTIINKCEKAGVSFFETGLADSGQSSKASRPVGRCQRPCVICGKTDFSTPAPCFNFSEMPDTWLCNLELPQC